MHMLVPLAALLGIEVDVITRRIKANATLWGVIGVLALIAFGFLLAAAQMALAERVGAIFACLIMAGTALALAFVVWIAWAITQAAQRRREADRKRSSETTALITTAALTALPMVLRTPLGRNLGLTAAALAAVVMFGRSNASKRGDDGEAG